MSATRIAYNAPVRPRNPPVAPLTVEQLLVKAEDQLAAAVYTIGLLSHKLRTNAGYTNGHDTAPEPVELPRRRVAPATPVQPAQPERGTRRQGAAQRVIKAVLSRKGVLVSEAHEIAGFHVSAAYLDRLAQTNNFTWWPSGEGANRRYIGNRKV